MSEVHFFFIELEEFVVITDVTRIYVFVSYIFFGSVAVLHAIEEDPSDQEVCTPAWSQPKKLIFYLRQNLFYVLYLLYLPIEWTRGGTNPASFSWLSGFDCNSIKVCSMFRNVVGVRVGVVRVGTPEFRPSRVINCNKKEQN